MTAPIKPVGRQPAKRRTGVAQPMGELRDPSPLPSVLTVSEAARLLRISRNSAYEAARRGELPTVRMGRRLLVPRAALEWLLEQGASPEQDIEVHRGR